MRNASLRLSFDHPTDGVFSFVPRSSIMCCRLEVVSHCRKMQQAAGVNSPKPIRRHSLTRLQPPSARATSFHPRETRFRVNPPARIVSFCAESPSSSKRIPKAHRQTCFPQSINVREVFLLIATLFAQVIWRYHNARIRRRYQDGS